MEHILVNNYKSFGIKEVKYVKQSAGHYCGYITISKDHPVAKDCINKTYPEEIANNWVDVHGGVTHTRRKEDGFVIGFDLAHAGDEHLNINNNYVVEQLEKLGTQLAKITENAQRKAEEKQKIIDWYIDDFKGLKGDTTGLSDTMEELINALSDSAFKKHIKYPYIDVMNDMARDRQIERMKHRMRLIIDDATTLLNLLEQGYSLDEYSKDNDHLWYFLNNIQEVVESNVNEDCEVDNWKVNTENK
mgnify:CR=1 FL=1